MSPQGAFVPFDAVHDPPNAALFCCFASGTVSLAFGILLIRQLLLFFLRFVYWALILGSTKVHQSTSVQRNYIIVLLLSFRNLGNVARQHGVHRGAPTPAMRKQIYNSGAGKRNSEVLPYGRQDQYPRVAERVLSYDDLFGYALSSCGTQIIRVKDLKHARPCLPR